MDLRIEWLDKPSQGWSDLLPQELYAFEKTRTGIHHEVLGPSGELHHATCDIHVEGETVVFDYTPYKHDNRAHFLGALTLHFKEKTRIGLPYAVLWRDGRSGMDTAGEVDLSFLPSRSGDELEVFADGGDSLQAHFSLRDLGSVKLVTLESRGGRIGTPNERNRGYSVALRMLLLRLAACRSCLEGAVLVSRAAEAQDPDLRARIVQAPELPMPIALHGEFDTDSVAAALQRALGGMSSSRQKGRGNNTRRLELVVGALDRTAHIPNLAEFLSTGKLASVVTEQELEGGYYGDFEMLNPVDARERKLAALVVRQGQPKFRRALEKAYGGTCAVTGCSVMEVLEAAHIVAYKGDLTNHVQNGLLLRADVHTLFDLGKLAINPEDWTVVLHQTLINGPYAQLHGAKIRLPENVRHRPSPEALRKHLEDSGLA